MMEMGAAGIRRASDGKRGADLMRDVGRRRSAENETAGVIDEIILDRRVATNKSAAGSEGFSAGVHGSKNAAAIRQVRDDAAAFEAANADSVSFIDDQFSAVAAGELHELAEGDDIAFHAENAFGDDELRAGRACVFLKGAFEKAQIAVGINDFAGVRKANAVDETGMIERVGEDDVAIAQNGTEQADIGGVAGAEVERGFRTNEIRELGFDGFPVARVSGKQARASGGDARGRGKSSEDGLLQARIRGESEIVVRAEIEAPRNIERAKLRMLAQFAQFGIDATAQVVFRRCGKRR